jgi:hypothetical protein
VSDDCFQLTMPGSVIYTPPIDLLVRDTRGRGQALGDTAIAYRGTDSAVSDGAMDRDTLHLRAGFQRTGIYTVRVKRRYYQDAIVSGIVVAPGKCGSLLPATVPVTLELLPGAPALRAIQVMGAEFLYAPGRQRQLVARFDAEPSVPTTVVWRLSDTTLARIDGTGLVTAKCSTKGGSITATALATADTFSRGAAAFAVGAATSCP